MSLLTADELEWMLEDTGGKTVTLGAEQTIGHRDVVDMVRTDGSDLEIRTKELSLVVATGTLPSLARGVTLVWDGATNYRVRDLEPDDPEEGLTRIFVAKE